MAINRMEAISWSWPFNLIRSPTKKTKKQKEQCGYYTSRCPVMQQETRFSPPPAPGSYVCADETTLRNQRGKSSCGEREERTPHPAQSPELPCSGCSLPSLRAPLPGQILCANYIVFFLIKQCKLQLNAFLLLNLISD